MMSADFFTWLPVPLLLGALLGFSGGVFGIGGGIIAIPVLTTFFDMDQKLAQGTALVMMLPNLIIALWRYSQRQPLPLVRTLVLAGLAMTATAATAHFASQLDSALLRRCFGLFLLWLSLHILWQRYVARSVPADNSERKPWHLPERLLPLVGVWGGACSGLLGIGGGLVATPVFVGLFRLRQVVAQGLALALVTPSTGVALATFSRAGLVDWRMGSVLALGGFFMVSPGVKLAHHLPEKTLRTAFAWMLGATALWIIVGG
ncbi:MAG TPA: sulfite exporter TauE/SafE family protein [Rhodocyclaceae bacterium]|nr:sulfite exporter TauE/SafE family protein [Rhodocyclaceae bacterium]